MLTKESHEECDEVYALDPSGLNPDVQMLIYEDRIILSQLNDASHGYVDVVVITPEQLEMLMASFQLEAGVYDQKIGKIKIQ